MGKPKNPQRWVPTPKGIYKVGCTDIMTTYSNEGVFIRLFYPVSPTAGQNQTMEPEWLPEDPKKYLEGYAIFFKIWPPLFCKTFPKFVGDVHTPAAWDVPPLRIPGVKFPVLVFSHGLGGCRTTYTTYCLELASHGTVIAAIEHRDYSACNTFYFTEQKADDSERNDDLPEDQRTSEVKESTITKHWMILQKVKQGKGEYPIRNKQVHHRARECGAVLDLLEDLDRGNFIENVAPKSHLKLSEFAGLLDTTKVSVCGHSFGGATVIATMASDKRFKVGVGLDTWMLPLREETTLFSKVDQPMLFLNMQKFQTKANLRVMKKMESSKSDRRIITLKGTVHLNQCDVPFLCDKPMRTLFGAHSSMNRFTAMDLTTRLSMSFINNHTEMPLNQDHEKYIIDRDKMLLKGIHVN